MGNVPGSVVTPEAVRLDYVIGGIASRTFAKIIDVLALGATWLGLTLATHLIGQLLVVQLGVAEQPVDIGMRIADALALFFVVVFAVPLCETRWNGRTPGKAMLGLRVVTDIGETVGFSHAIVRGMVQLVELPTGIALITALTNPRNQRLGDLSAGTFVIHDRGQLVAPLLTPTVFPPPPHCEQVVAAIDVSQLTSQEFAFLRDYLLRVRELTPAARYELGIHLVQRLVPLVGTSPPPTMPPELFINCVASAYQLKHFDGRLPVGTR